MPVQKGFWDYFWFAKIILQAAGILPIGGTPSPWKTILTECLTVFPLLIGCYYVIPELNYILFRSHATDDLLESTIIVNNVVGGQLRSIFMAINRRKIARLFDVCSTLWDQAILEDYEVIFIWAQWAKLFSTIYFFAAQFSISTFVLAAIIKQLSFPANSTTRYYPFQVETDFTSSPQYEIKFSLQVIFGYLGNSFIAAVDITGTLLALNMCGQFALIRSWLLDFAKEEWTITRGKIDKSLEVTLKKCIHRHQIVLDFCTELEEVVRYINMAQILTSIYALAVAATRLTQTFEYRWIGPLLLPIGCIFFACWPAGNLFFASTEVAQAVYGVPWYRLSPREKTAVALMLMRSQRPAKLTVGKFVPLSLETFTTIISNSVSLCMVLNRFE